ncbi:uncharacterized protein N7515_004744 [Penicillium bovifimosum]|uniref:Uncharacterized protein n=1 Tax=Penicillium bovifimosum TaxID=126998 RepID=A0A9W9L3S7_9EURO|nr:uncharacterized protein N7515_004744 [Penicillium bovifimosum]KAJ5135466.1 hypothetical protein N7515_004744 [Penicillium bovifimosum]
MLMCHILILFWWAVLKMTLQGQASGPLSEVDPSNAAEYLGQHEATSHVENLYLVGHSMFTTRDLQALLSRPEKLKRLSLYNSEGYGHDRLSRSELWASLRQHSLSLESIDIYCVDLVMTMGHFGQLNIFKNLKDLRINTDVLLSRYIHSPISAFSLSETLPESVQTLVLYGQHTHHSAFNIPRQLQELTSKGLLTLKSVGLEKPWFEIGEDDDLCFGQDGAVLYQALRAFLSSRGVDLSRKKPQELSMGGAAIIIMYMRCRK